MERQIPKLCVAISRNVVLKTMWMLPVLWTGGWTVSARNVGNRESNRVEQHEGVAC